MGIFIDDVSQTNGVFVDLSEAKLFIFCGVGAMLNIQDLVDGLISKDNNQAYQCLKQLKDKSSHSAEVYEFFDTFVEMMNNANSYIRTRGIVLIAASAKWDVDNKIDEIIDKYLKYIIDDKPITARQCIKVLPSIVKYKPYLKRDIENALRHANISRYKENMQPLILRDIQKSLHDVEGDILHETKDGFVFRSDGYDPGKRIEIYKIL